MACRRFKTQKGLFEVEPAVLKSDGKPSHSKNGESLVSHLSQKNPPRRLYNTKCLRV